MSREAERLLEVIADADSARQYAADCNDPERAAKEAETAAAARRAYGRVTGRRPTIVGLAPVLPGDAPTPPSAPKVDGRYRFTAAELLGRIA